MNNEYRATGTPKSKEVFLQQFIDKKYQDFFNAVKDDSNLNDQATLYAKDVLEHTLTEGDLNNKFTEDINCTTKEYLDALSLYDPCFDFRLHTDAEGHVTRIAWMTGAMRASFELYGYSISLDAMKHAFNTSCYPYHAIVMSRDDGSNDIAVESVMIGEDVENYAWLINALFAMAEGRKKADVFVVSADDFINQKMVVEEFGLVNAHFILDRWHLTNINMPKAFAPQRWNLVQDNIEKMFRAESEEIHTRLYAATKGILEERLCPETELEYLRKFRERKNEYASYAIKCIPGSKMIKGSSRSEQTHSTIHSFLGKDYCQPIFRFTFDQFGSLSQRYISPHPSKEQFFSHWHAQALGNREESFAQSTFTKRSLPRYSSNRIRYHN